MPHRERKKTKYHKKMAKMTEDERKEYNKKRCEAQRKVRKSKKQKKANPNKNTSPLSIFKSPQNLGKAVQRVRNSLPKSSSKVPAVISKIVETLSPRKRKAVIDSCDKSAKRKKYDDVERKKRSDALTEEKINKVKEF